MKGFVEFIRERGVVGLTVGFLLGGAISKLISSLLADLINPLLGLLLSNTKGLEAAKFTLGGATIMYGHFLSVLLDFIVLSLVVYFFIKGLRLDRLDKKK